MAAQQTQQFHTSYKEFVDPKVITIPVTEDIIKAVMPFFPKSAKVISGYLSVDQLYWKVNYHWELLGWAIDRLLATKRSDEVVNLKLKAIKTALNSNTPTPNTGYRTSSKPGYPKDELSDETILLRHAIVAKAKADLKALVGSAKLDKDWKLDSKALMLAYAPVASPKNGKHRFGWALDIKGNNAEIKRIAASLGAIKPFDEGSHVHCEWPNGVDTSKTAGADGAAAAARAADFAVRGNLLSARHFCTPA